MQYLLLIYQDESGWANASDSEKAGIYQEYMALSKNLAETGKMKGGNELQPTSAATTVRIRDGKRSITDGPFAETKEQLGGFYMVEANDLDDAIAIAERIPAARQGCIEVRPVVKH